MPPALYNIGNAEHGTADPVLPDRFYNPRNWGVPSQTGTVANATQYFGPFRKAGVLQQLAAAITEVIATGADRTVTIDLQKSTGGGAFASVLSSTLVFNSSSTLRLASLAALNTTTFIAGDLFKLTVTVAGAAGAQAQGLTIHLAAYEAP